MSKIFEQQIIDFTTGEVKTMTSVRSYNNDERFGFYRTTTGAEWVFNWTANELQFMIYLSTFEDEHGAIKYTSLVKKQLCTVSGKTDRFIRTVIKSLEDKNGLVKLTTTDLVLNPRYFYRGGTKTIKDKIENYDKTRRELYGTLSLLECSNEVTGS